jgi:hypothetical protein
MPARGRLVKGPRAGQAVLLYVVSFLAPTIPLFTLLGAVRQKTLAGISTLV